jgi:hypothetical protein
LSIVVERNELIAITELILQEFDSTEVRGVCSNISINNLKGEGEGEKIFSREDIDETIIRRPLRILIDSLIVLTFIALSIQSSMLVAT